jgi:outer membrane receptor protein involved in Fe transport
MIERVEVLTGGASATYGSDAVAGVVNFILKDHIQGIQVDGQYQIYEHSQHSQFLRDSPTKTQFNPWQTFCFDAHDVESGFSGP